MSQSDFALFMGQLARRPHQVVALAPSSRFLCAEMVAELDPDGGPVIELGAGTGNITARDPGPGHRARKPPFHRDEPGVLRPSEGALPRPHVHQMSAGDVGDLPSMMCRP
jgi:phosphatidylethanolamine/phosphatidyl-N-methylethanolamine N-methyltransferase